MPLDTESREVERKQYFPLNGNPVFQTNEELQDKISEYFLYGVAKKKFYFGKDKESCTEVPNPTITGLVLYCGFADRKSFYDLVKTEKFSYTAKRARTFIEKEYEELLKDGVSTAKFALQQFDWTDTQKIDMTVKDTSRLLELRKKIKERDTSGND